VAASAAAAAAGGPVLLCCSSQTFACGRYRLCWPIFHARTPPGHAVSSLKLWGFMLFHSFFRLFYWILFWGYPPFHVLKLVRLLCYSHSGFSFRFVLWNKKEKRSPKICLFQQKKSKGLQLLEPFRYLYSDVSCHWHGPDSIRRGLCFASTFWLVYFHLLDE
jgi:hypothetical protein